MIIEYADKAWVLYAGNENILTETYANYYTYLTHLEYCKNKGYKFMTNLVLLVTLEKIIPVWDCMNSRKNLVAIM